MFDVLFLCAVFPDYEPPGVCDDGTGQETSQDKSKENSGESTLRNRRLERLLRQLSGNAAVSAQDQTCPVFLWPSHSDAGSHRIIYHCSCKLRIKISARIIGRIFC